MDGVEVPVSTSTNEREFDRLPVQNKVKVIGKGRMGMYAIAINMSLGGVLLSATPALPVGSRCDVTLFDGGEHSILAKGTVVRSNAEGTAIRFVSTLAEDHLKALVNLGDQPFLTRLVDAYVTYFQVGRNTDNLGCERLLGVTRKTYRTVFFSTFSACLPAAIIPVWYVRGVLQVLPIWERIAACFLYGALWYLFIQPGMDLTLLHFLRKRKATT